MPVAKNALISDLANRMGNLGVEVADIAGHLEELTGRATQQAQQFKQLKSATEARIAGNRETGRAARETQSAASSAGAEIAESRELIGGAVHHMAQLTGSVTRIEERLDSFNTVIRQIGESTAATQHTDHAAFTDRVLPSIQDPLQKMDPRIVFCVAWARGGHLPTRKANYRLPQGPDPAWNAANCRNRRLFDDRAVRKVAQNRKPFLLQTYRRNMGGGQYVLMKDLSSPIVVDGRHCSAFRMGFRQT